MKYLAIDLGTYSIKTMLVNVERKQISLLDSSEFILNDLKAEMDPDGDELSLKRILLENIIPEDFDGKVIYQLPNKMVTSRHLTLPVTQKKKVDLMIPFQLDELLPYSSMDAHFFSQQIKEAESTSALVNVTKRKDFEEYFTFMEEKDVLPTVLTTELSTLHAHAQNKQTRGPIAILDIGHRTSKCYIIYQGEVVSHHFSFCAGATIDEVISETYNIPLNDAVIYKHQNCFLLTEGQYDEVSEEQRDFALLMKKTLNPLVLEMKRWLLGFRVKYGVPIENVYLSGGSSHIHNINNFLSQQIGTKVDFASLGESLLDSEEQMVGQECTYYLGSLMASNLAQKFKPGNFLHGDFSNGSSLSLPLHSAAFYAQRALIASVVFSLLLGVDIYLQGKKSKQLDRQIKKILAQKELGVTAAQRRRIDFYLDKIVKKIERKNQGLEKELKALQDSNAVDALPALFTLSKMISAEKDIELISFDSSGKKVDGVFKVAKEDKLRDLQALLKRSSLPSLKVTAKGDRLSFNFIGSGE
jgi:Tfp pilus assembly PilM family ATPase